MYEYDTALSEKEKRERKRRKNTEKETNAYARHTRPPNDLIGESPSVRAARTLEEG